MSTEEKPQEEQPKKPQEQAAEAQTPAPEEEQEQESPEAATPEEAAPEPEEEQAPPAPQQPVVENQEQPQAEAQPQPQEQEQAQATTPAEEKTEAEAQPEEKSEQETAQPEEVQPKAEAQQEEPDAEQKPKPKQAEEEPGFSEMSKEELVAYVKEAASHPDIISQNRNVVDARTRFDSIIEEETKQQKEEFMQQEGVSEIDFRPKHDPLRDEFRDAFRAFRKKRKEAIDELKKEREQNLKAKEEVLEKMKALAENMDKANHFNEFKELQEQWNAIGHVPREEYDNLKRNFDMLRNRFFQNLSIYSEMKELDRQKNFEHKQELLKKVQEVAEMEDINEARHHLRTLQKDWNRVGPVPQDKYEALEKQYHEAVDEVMEKRKAWQAEQDAQHQRNLEAKQEVLAKISEFADFKADKPRDWVEANKKLSGWIERWKEVGFIPRQEHKKLSKQLREAVGAFNHNKGQFFKELKEDQAENLAQREKLCEKVEAILQKDQAEIPQYKDEVLRLQQEWKQTGPVKPSVSEEMWKRFRSACDQFFDKLTESNKGQREEEKENLKKKEELVQRALKLAEEEPEAVKEQVKELQNEWRNIGFVPIKQKDRILKEFNNALKKLIKTSGDEDLNPEMVTYAMQLDQLAEHPDANRILGNEERKIYRDIRSIEEEMVTLDNNLAFFRNSKAANKMKEDFEQKLARYKRQVESLREKLKMVRRKASSV